MQAIHVTWKLKVDRSITDNSLVDSMESDPGSVGYYMIEMRHSKTCIINIISRDKKNHQFFFDYYLFTAYSGSQTVHCD